MKAANYMNDSMSVLATELSKVMKIQLSLHNDGEASLLCLLFSRVHSVDIQT